MNLKPGLSGALGLQSNYQGIVLKTHREARGIVSVGLYCLQPSVRLLGGFSGLWFVDLAFRNPFPTTDPKP